LPIPIELRQASKLEALHLPVRANEVLAERLEAHCFVANSAKASVQQLDQPETAEQWNDALL
jgi:hypothetical protein